jgi:hypothetical protein
MSLVDLLLNVAALIMWVSWRGIRGTEAAGTAGTILGNLRAAGVERPSRWPYLAWLVGLLLFRAILYRQMGPNLAWHPGWSHGAATLVFRSDSFPRMLAFSGLGFLSTLLFWYTGLAGILALHRPPMDRDGITRALRRQAPWLANLPGWLLLMLVAAAAGVSWLAIGSMAARHGLVPPLRGERHLLQQALVVAAGQWCVLRWWIAVLLVLHFVHLYVHLGNQAVWEFVQNTGQKLSRPFAFLRVGHLDAAPLVALVVYWTLLTWIGHGLPGLRKTLPGMPDWVEFGVLPYVFRNLPY